MQTSYQSEVLEKGAKLDSIGDSVIKESIPDYFCTLLKSQPSVANLFSKHSCENWVSYLPSLSEPDAKDIEKLAILVVAKSISKIETYGFKDTINSSVVSSRLECFLSKRKDFIDRIKTAIYTQLFVAKAATNDGLSFFTSKTSPDLIEAYKQYVSRQDYITQMVTLFQTAQPDARHKIMLVTFKLKQLNDQAYTEVKNLYEKNSLPVFENAWDDLSSPPCLSEDALFNDLSPQLNQSQQIFNEISSSIPFPVLPSFTVIYAPNIADFVKSIATNWGLTTEKEPNNIFIKGIFDN